MPKDAKSSSKETKGKSNKGLIIIIVIAAILVGLVLLGKLVSKVIAEKFTSGFLSRVTGQNVNVSGDGKNITVKTDKGDVTINSGGSLPSDFPKDFPIYPGAKLTGSFSAKGTNGENSKGLSVVWETNDDAAKIGSFYRSALASAGYTISTEYSQSNSTTLTFEKGDVSGFLGVTKGNDGKTAISVTMGTN